MSSLYKYILDEALDLSTLDGFLVRFLDKQYFEGRLISNSEVERLKADIQSGEYSQQFEAYIRYRQRMSGQPRYNQGKKEGEFFGSYTDIRNSSDALYNKKMCLSRVLGIQTLLQETYGEVNYRKALLTELILNAPFLDTVAQGNGINDEAHTRHNIYLKEIIEFTQKFTPKDHFSTFVNLTEQLPAQWSQEIKPPKISEFDRIFLEQIYSYTDRLLNQDYNLDQIYALLQKTIVRRGELFLAKAIHTPFGTFLSLDPSEKSNITFDDIAGYAEQKDFYLKLLKKTEVQDPIVGDIRIVIAAGEPGLGKSIGVQAFLNNLPENARGMLVQIGNVRGTDEFDLLTRLARIHPELEIFTVIEDIDALAGDRLINPTTRRFLEIDSAITGSVPRNFHLIATTNRPDVIDPAVIRPGRTAKILIYEYPNKKDRRNIASLHALKNNLKLSEEILDEISVRSKRLTPDEVRHIVWCIRYDEIENPTVEDIKKLIKDTKRKQNMGIKARTQSEQKISPDPKLPFSFFIDGMDDDNEDDFDEDSEEGV